MNITKTVLKRPVTTVLCVLCLMVFGFISLFSSTMELTPEMNMPMMVISTVYVGASPEDVDELLTKPVENEVGQLVVWIPLPLFPVKILPWCCCSTTTARIWIRRIRI